MFNKRHIMAIIVVVLLAIGFSTHTHPYDFICCVAGGAILGFLI